MIHSFIERYQASLEEFDAKTVLPYYSFPVPVFTENGEAILFDEEVFLAYSGQLFKEYQSLGISKLDHKIISEEQLSENLMLVSITWQFIAPLKNAKYDATIRYVLSSTTTELKIVSVYIVDERKHFNAFKRDIGSK